MIGLDFRKENVRIEKGTGDFVNPFTNSKEILHISMIGYVIDELKFGTGIVLLRLVI
jgi:hypothetical protein